MKKVISYPDAGHNSYFDVEDQSFWFKKRNDWIFHTISAWFKSGSIIDLGGGNGFVSAMLQSNLNWEVTLVEPGLKGSNNAVRRGVKRVKTGTLDDVKNILPVSCFGLFDVLEHIEEPIPFLKKIHDSLKDEGMLFLTVPCYSFLWSGEDLKAGHFRRYNLKTLTSELEAGGFKVIESSYFFSILIPLIFIFRSIPYRLGKKSKKMDTGEHKSSMLSMILEGLLGLEFSLHKKIRIPFGSSLIVVARATVSS